MRSHGRGTRTEQDGLISPEQLARVSDANRTIDDLQNRLGQIATAVGQTQFSGDNTLLNTLEALQSAHTAVGGDYPYSGRSHTLALAGLTGLAGLWGLSQPGKRKTAPRPPRPRSSRASAGPPSTDPSSSPTWSRDPRPGGPWRRLRRREGKG